MEKDGKSIFVEVKFVFF